MSLNTVTLSDPLSSFGAVQMCKILYGFGVSNADFVTLPSMLDAFSFASIYWFWKFDQCELLLY